MLSSIIESPSWQQAKRQTLWNVVLDFWTLTCRDCSSFVEPLQQKPCQNQTKHRKHATKIPLKCTSKSLKIHSKMEPWRALGPLWAQLAFQGVSQGDLFAHLGALWAPLGTLWGPLGSTLEHFGVPRLSFWSPLGTMWHHLGDFGQLVKIAILWWEYYILDHFGSPWGTIFLNKFNKAFHVASLPAFFAIFL